MEEAPEGETQGQPDEAEEARKKEAEEARKKKAEEARKKKAAERQKVYRGKQKSLGVKKGECNLEPALQKVVKRFALRLQSVGVLKQSAMELAPGKLLPLIVEFLLLPKSPPAFWTVLSEFWANPEMTAAAPYTIDAPVRLPPATDFNWASSMLSSGGGIEAFRGSPKCNGQAYTASLADERTYEQPSAFNADIVSEQQGYSVLQSQSGAPSTSLSNMDQGGPVDGCHPDSERGNFGTEEVHNEFFGTGDPTIPENGWPTPGASRGGSLAISPCFNTSPDLPENSLVGEALRTANIGPPDVSQRSLRQAPNMRLEGPSLSDRIKENTDWRRRATIIAPTISCWIRKYLDKGDGTEETSKRIYDAVRQIYIAVRRVADIEHEGPSTDNGQLARDLAEVLALTSLNEGLARDGLNNIKGYFEEKQRSGEKHAASFSDLCDLVDALLESLDSPDTPKVANGAFNGSRPGNGDEDPFGGGGGAFGGPCSKRQRPGPDNSERRSSTGASGGSSRGFVSTYGGGFGTMHGAADPGQGFLAADSSAGDASIVGEAPLGATGPHGGSLGGPKRDEEMEREVRAAGAGAEEGSGDNFATVAEESRCADDGGLEREGSSIGDRVPSQPQTAGPVCPSNLGGQDASDVVGVRQKRTCHLDGTAGPRDFGKHGLRGRRQYQRQLIEEYGKDGFVYIPQEKRLGKARYSLFVDKEGAYYRTYQQVENQWHARRTASDSKAGRSLSLALGPPTKSLYEHTLNALKALQVTDVQKQVRSRPLTEVCVKLRGLRQRRRAALWSPGYPRC